MIHGIVGVEGKKLTPLTEAKARERIRNLLREGDVVVSGACHLGGIDIIAIEEAKKLGLETLEFPPRRLQWEGGYKQRNIKIAEMSDMVTCITVRTLPEGFKGMTFPKCYHCNRTDHVKSGGCWTMKYAERLGKIGNLIVLE